jgi:predicted DNA-binding transcriptional regulator AlpA
VPRLKSSTKKIVNVHEVAALLGVTHTTIRYWIKRGRFLRPLPFSGKLLWDAASLEKWIAEQQGAAHATT